MKNYSGESDKALYLVESELSLFSSLLSSLL
jgi:hypothetical protein